MGRPPLPPAGITDTIPFGDYADELVGTAIETDPKYVDWMVNKTHFRLDDAALKYLEENL